MTEKPRHFLEISQYDRAELAAILDHSAAMKARRAGWPRGATEPDRPLDGKVLAMIFEKPSTRTRVSFDVAMRQMGGQTLVLSASEMQLGRGETFADTARVLSRFVDGIMIRTDANEKLAGMAEYASVPVINGLTDDSHPCQIMADMQTLREKKGKLAGLKVAWCGDFNNVTNSFVHAATRFGFRLDIAFPEEVEANSEVLSWARENGGDIHTGHDAGAAVEGADCVVTDTWVSMGDDETANLHNRFQPFQVNAALMAKARPDAIFMHCLPAHRGEEVTDEVMDGPQSVVFDEAENRLHAQKAILAFCMGNDK
ncbi:MAG TPA: ornithine carbamoyltransferase [Rhizobiales bacterium]|nr:ornithine carbamoyltransferase [Hyphomicrobiales bacterium]